MRISAIVACFAIGTTASASAQIPVDYATQVQSVAFQVVGAPVPDGLADRVVSRGRGGMVGLRRALRWVPLIPAVPDRPFDPLELQRDKVRLREYFRQIGYPDVAVDYDVVHDEIHNVVDITFLVTPGAPVVVEALTLQWRDAVPDPSLAGDELLDHVRSELGLLEGEPLDESTIPRAAAMAARWLGERGHAFATVDPQMAVDSTARRARIVLRATAGPRARVRAIAVTGAKALSPDEIRSYSSVRPGDWFSPTRLQEAARGLMTLDAVRRATVEIPRDQQPDTLIDVRFRVLEEPPRLIGGSLGYGTDGGITAEGFWTHRQFGNAARTLSATLVAQTGALALDDLAEKEVRGSMTFRQPLRGLPRLTLNVGPFGAYRNDYRDRSVQGGLQTTVAYQLGPLSAVALRYELSVRRIMDYRFGDFLSGIDLLSLLQLAAQGVLDSLGTTLSTSTVTLSASLGAVETPADPRRGFVIEPSLVTTVPGALSSTQYVTGNLRVAGYLPIGSGTIAARVGIGKLFPFGKSVPPTPDEGLREYFRLRDVLFTAGGMGDVRGWSTRLLGPKLPAIFFPVEGDSVGAPTADRYVPIGGFNRTHASVEIRAPIPLLGSAWQAHAFVDAGRVWTDDERFTSSDDPLGVEKLFWAAGVGVDYITIIGAIRVAVARKMNPSILDLLDPGAAAQAILSGTPFTALPTKNSRRYRIHIGLGRWL